MPTRFFSTCLLLAISALPVRAADWPQFLGPTRNGVSTETGLLKTFPRTGPALLWQVDVGEGYSGPVVADSRLILFHRLGNQEVVECLDAGTGKQLWKFAYPSNYQDDYGKGNGPRATPTIAGKQVFTLGPDGDLLCLDLQTGKKTWQRALHNEYQVPKGFFGVATSPLVEGDLVLVNVGGRNAGIVAFDRNTGKEGWKATNHEASYSSPVAATVAGQRLVFFFTREGLDILDGRTGAVRASKRWRARINASVNAATPLVLGDLVFISASYQTGANLLRLTKDGLEDVWKGDDILSNHYNTSVEHKGFLYGIDGRQEGGARLRCVDLKTGKIRWTEEGFGCGTIIVADGTLLILTESGDLVLAEATPLAYRPKARAKILGPCRAPMALSGGKLYARDRGKLGCWKLTP